MQKFIVCGKCKYFPNKADQVKGKQVKIHSNTIQWYCVACQTMNKYPNQQAVVLPETYLVQFNKDNLLSNQQGNRLKNIAVIIDFNNVKASMGAYYTPWFKEQVSKICEIEEQNVKNIDVLESQSQWFTKYRLILKGFTKFLGQQNRGYERNSQAGYLIYLIHHYASSLFFQSRNQVKLTIHLLSKNEIYCFNIEQINTMSQNLINCLKLYSLLQIEDKIPWLLNFYSKQFAEYKLKRPKQGKIDKLMLIGDHYQMNQESIKMVLAETKMKIQIKQLISNQNIVILKSRNSDMHSNIYKISPFSKQSFLNYVNKSKSNTQDNSQQMIIYYKTKRSKEIAIRHLTAYQQPKVKQLLLSKPVTQGSLKDACKEFIQDHNQHNKVKLLKIYCKFNIADEKKIVLYTFNWHKIEKELIFQELDEEITQQHQLKEDVLNQGIIKLNSPSPFMKKNSTYLKAQEEHQTNEEDYQYL